MIVKLTFGKPLNIKQWTHGPQCSPEKLFLPVYKLQQSMFIPVNWINKISVSTF